VVTAADKYTRRQEGKTASAVTEVHCDGNALQ